MSAPRLVTRALVTSFLTVALVLGAVFAVLSRACSRSGAPGGGRQPGIGAAGVHEGRRRAGSRTCAPSVATLAENPTLKAALDTWLTERRTADERTSKELLATVQREADKIADRVVGRRARGRRCDRGASSRAAAGWRRHGRAASRSAVAVDRDRADRSRHRRRQRHVSRGVGAAADWRRDDWIARARHRARRATTRASWPTCRAVMRPSCRRAPCWPAR